MRKLMSGLLAAATLLGASAAAEASPLLVRGVETPAQPALLQDVQYVYSGHDYCWYDRGWHGPGFYWCGYSWHRGFGWGGGYGWRGWGGREGWRNGVWIGGPGWHGHPEWGGWRGERDFHGEHRGDHRR